MPTDSPLLSQAISNNTVTLEAREWASVVQAFRYYIGLTCDPDYETEFTTVSEINPSAIFRSMLIQLGVVGEDSTIKLIDPHSGDVIDG